jgi:hypothetical protein
MAKPKRIKDPAANAAVLKEYSHLCAICARPDPQVHHIDENPSNNDILNLLPLCPNHHLSDQHNPTRKIEPTRLRLFRIHKDPVILKPQFQPLFYRMKAVIDSSDPLRGDALARAAADLIAFVAALEMGTYYGTRLRILLTPPDRPTASFHPETAGQLEVIEEEMRQKEAKWELDCKKMIAHARTEVVRLIVELLRYQNWPDHDLAGPKNTRLHS